MKRTIVLFVGFLLFFTCYSCKLEELSFATKTFVFDSGKTFDYVQISGGVGDIQDELNRALEKAATEWVLSDSESYEWITSCDWEIVFLSQDYLTVCYSANLYNEGNDGCIRLYQTFSLKSGERLFLDDFVDEELFASIMVPTGDLSYDKAVNFWSEMYQYACISELDYLNILAERYPANPNSEKEFPLSFLLVKPELYLTNDGIFGVKLSEYADDDRIVLEDMTVIGGRAA